MAEEKPSELLGALPRSRPQRRSSKRPERNGEPAARSQQQNGEPAARRQQPARKSARPQTVSRSKPAKRPRRKPAQTSARLGQPPQPRGIPAQPRSPVPPSSERHDVLTTAVQAAVELTEIGLSLSARALRRAVSRLPRP